MYQDQQPTFVNFRNTMNLGSIMVRAFAVTIEVFLHARFGARYIGMQALAAIPGVFFFGMFWQGHDLNPLMYFLVAYMLMAVAQRVEAVRRFNLGHVEHSRYTGWPALLPKSCARLEEGMKHVIEPMLTGICGVVLGQQWNQPLGMYLIVAAICLFLSNSMDKAVETSQTLDLQDAIAEQRLKSRRFDQLRGRR